VGSCTLFVPPVYPLPPNGRVFGRFGVRPLHQKKRHPGIRGLSPPIAFCREMSAKYYWDGKTTGFLTKNLKSSWISKKSKNYQVFQKKSESRATTKMHYTMSYFFKNRTPPQNTQPLDFFPPNEVDYTFIDDRRTRRRRN